MSRAPDSLVTASLLVASACGSPEPSMPPSSKPIATSNASANGSVAATAAPRPTSPEPSSSAGEDEDAPWRCDKDADCHISCRYGAVNEAWFRSEKRNECKDGCQQGTSHVKCEEHVCVAYGRDKRDDGCTKRPIRKDD